MSYRPTSTPGGNSEEREPPSSPPDDVTSVGLGENKMTSDLMMRGTYVFAKPKMKIMFHVFRVLPPGFPELFPEFK